MNRRLLGVVILAAGVMSGCMSTGMARTLNRGQVQVSLVPGLIADANRSLGLVPRAEVGVRYGVTDRLDVSARLSTWGAAVDTRVGLLRSPTINRGVDLTLAPLLSVDARGQSDDKQVTAELPLLVGLNPGAGVQVVVGPRVGTTVVVDPSDVGVFHALLGASFGVAVPLGKWLRVVPEVMVRTPVRDPSPLLQANLGLLVGGYVEP